MEDLASLKELGIAGIAVVGFAYVCFKLIKELGENRKDYCNFVQTSNHTTTELVKESTATMVSVRASIDNHNQVLEKLLDKLDK